MSNLSAPQPYQQPTYPSYPAAVRQPIPISELTYDEQRTWGALVHFVSFFTGFAGAWFSYLLFRNRGAHIRQHAVAAFNFQLSALLWTAIAAPIALIPFIGVLATIFLIGLNVVRFVYFILSSQRAYRGEPAKIPLTINFVS